MVTEEYRRKLTRQINSKQSDRKDLEAEYGEVWNTKELQKDFKVLSFMAPFVHVIRKSDGQTGAMLFQHSPRFYFSFQEAEDSE